MRSFFLFLSVLAFAASYAQRKVTFKQADELKGAIKDGQQFNRLLGNVIMVQGNTTIYCDSAHLYGSMNSAEAFGHVRITDGDSVTITAATLEYSGNERRAKLRNNVVFTKLATATLHTDYLDYDRPRSMAYYYNGGKLVDSINVLTSQKGYYNVNSNLAAFKKNVEVNNPDYTMYADSLQYNSRSKIIYFVSQTTLIDKDSSSFTYDAGQYDTRTKSSDLRSGFVETRSYTIKGKSYALDDINKRYKIKGDVVINYKEEELTVYGQSSIYDRAKRIAKIYDNAFVAKRTDEGDTLFIRADTLVSIDSDDDSKKRLLAYNNVKVFKQDMQAISDSLEYRSADSTIYFYGDPVLWNGENQMTADSIRMLIENQTISKVFLNVNSFVISQDTLLNYNQIKGRRMVAEFGGNELRRVLVEGNGETLYFAIDEKTKEFMGMNKMLCSNIIIRFQEGKVNNLSFYIKPEAKFIPPHELQEEDKRLDEFTWRQEVRPQREDVVGKVEVVEQARPDGIDVPAPEKTNPRKRKSN